MEAFSQSDVLLGFTAYSLLYDVKRSQHRLFTKLLYELLLLFVKAVIYHIIQLSVAFTAEEHCGYRLLGRLKRKAVGSFSEIVTEGISL